MLWFFEEKVRFMKGWSNEREGNVVTRTMNRIGLQRRWHLFVVHS